MDESEFDRLFRGAATTDHEQAPSLWRGLLQLLAISATVGVSIAMIGLSVYFVVRLFTG